MTLVAYARVSTDDQTTALQLDALRKAGVGRIFEEQASRGRWDRPKSHAMLASLRAGDTVLVWKIDRLSRSLSDLVRIMELIDQRGAALKSLTEPIDTTTAVGKALMQMVGVFAELERANLKERTNAGIQAAKTNGVKFGRPQKLTDVQRVDIVRRVNAKELTAADAARLFQVGRATISRLLPSARGMGPS
ncbi:recombinase family protein [Deinococcus sp. QL22]|uniref:recombinase family protein n=1 Tax=Deinococcus sp. QL22 TaxID=2939437 RepID=UPI002017976B|nr:recombinase family protein [Deinococcus sp. QL22]UQN10176.1 recombinase family protein [Deinococcus sp. QL22]